MRMAVDFVRLSDARSLPELIANFPPPYRHTLHLLLVLREADNNCTNEHDKDVQKACAVKCWLEDTYEPTGVTEEDASVEKHLQSAGYDATFRRQIVDDDIPIDPDVVFKGVVLDTKDVSAEHALLVEVWNALRIGSLEKAQNACRKAKQYWRATSLQYESSSIYRNSCIQLAKHTQSALERRIYLLLGHSPDVVDHCDSWEDRLWAGLFVDKSLSQLIETFPVSNKHQQIQRQLIENNFNFDTLVDDDTVFLAMLVHICLHETKQQSEQYAPLLEEFVRRLAYLEHYELVSVYSAYFPPSQRIHIYASFILALPTVALRKQYLLQASEHLKADLLPITDKVVHDIVSRSQMDNFSLEALGSAGFLSAISPLQKEKLLSLTLYQATPNSEPPVLIALLNSANLLFRQFALEDIGYELLAYLERIGLAPLPPNVNTGIASMQNELHFEYSGWISFNAVVMCLFELRAGRDTNFGSNGVIVNSFPTPMQPKIFSDTDLLRNLWTTAVRSLSSQSGIFSSQLPSANPLRNLRDTCLPKIIFLLLVELHRFQQLEAALQLMDMIADEQTQHYTAFSPDDLQLLLQRLRRLYVQVHISASR